MNRRLFFAQATGLVSAVAIAPKLKPVHSADIKIDFVLPPLKPIDWKEWFEKNKAGIWVVMVDALNR